MEQAEEYWDLDSLKAQPNGKWDMVLAITWLASKKDLTNSWKSWESIALWLLWLLWRLSIRRLVGFLMQLVATLKTDSWNSWFRDIYMIDTIFLWFSQCNSKGNSKDKNYATKVNLLLQNHDTPPIMLTIGKAFICAVSLA